MASMADRSGTRGLWQPNLCFGRGGSSGSIFAHSASGKRQPSSRTTRFFGWTLEFLVMRRIWNPKRSDSTYRDRLLVPPAAKSAETEQTNAEQSQAGRLGHSLRIYDDRTAHAIEGKHISR
jgi:hypothetical protein